MKLKSIRFCKCIFLLGIIFLMTDILYAQNKYGGMIKCSDFLWIDQTPVTVDSWISYYNWIKNNEGEGAAAEVLPDSNKISSNVWKYIKFAEILISKGEDNQVSIQTGQKTVSVAKCPEITNCDNCYKEKKVKRCPYGNYPITGITYKQVIDYCNWKTKMLGANEVIFRLPSSKERKQIVLQGLKGEHKLLGIKDSTCNEKSTCAAFNYKLVKGTEDYDSWGENGMSLKQVDYFAPNELGVYDLFGNVSEMIQERGIAKGGNFKLYAAQCNVDSIQYFTEPEVWLGFRCVAVTR